MVPANNDDCPTSGSDSGDIVANCRSETTKGRSPNDLAVPIIPTVAGKAVGLFTEDEIIEECAKAKEAMSSV